MSNYSLRPRKRIGRMCRGRRLGKIVPFEEGEIAGKSESEVGESKE